MTTYTFTLTEQQEEDLNRLFTDIDFRMILACTKFPEPERVAALREDQARFAALKLVIDAGRE
jgi:hypothetical protein